MTKFRCYDRVSIDAEVVAVRHDCIVIAIKTGKEKTNVYVDKDQLTLVSCAPPDVGDRVMHVNCPSTTYKVVAIHGKHAWLEQIEGIMSTALMSNLIVVGRD